MESLRALGFQGRILFLSGCVDLQLQTWICGSKKFESLVPDVCVIYHFQLASGLDYFFCLRDAANGIGFNSRLNAHSKSKRTPEDIKLIQKFKEIQAAGKTGELLRDCCVKATENPQHFWEESDFNWKSKTSELLCTLILDWNPPNPTSLDASLQLFNSPVSPKEILDLLPKHQEKLKQHWKGVNDDYDTIAKNVVEAVEAVRHLEQGVTCTVCFFWGGGSLCC